MTYTILKYCPQCRKETTWFKAKFKGLHTIECCKCGDMINYK